MKESGKLSSILVNVVYIRILLMVVIAALQVLSMEAISEPAITM